MMRTIRGTYLGGLAVIAIAVLAFTAATAAAQDPSASALTIPSPQPDPTTPNIFYGAQLPTADNGPVLVFVHGLHGTASDWWVNNDMYAKALAAGFRTAFVSLNADNSPNDAGIDENAAMLKSLLPIIVNHFNVQQVYMIGHSKGGVDIQGMLLFPTMPSLVRAVFTISSPNSGTEIADWAFGPGLPLAGQLNLLTPGVFSLQTTRMASFRALADPILKNSGIPFYTLEGTTFLGNPITEITGAILKQLVPDQFNDGLVTVERAKLPPDYAADLGTLDANHFLTDNGYYSFSRIAGQITGIETEIQQFNRVAVNGLGDPHNTFAWSMQWFKGKLYVGTGREVRCVSLATSDATQGTHTYPIAVFGQVCPDFQTLETSLQAEIWQYTPETKQWQRVYQSPATIPVGVDGNGNPIFTGRDAGFRGMTVFTESDGSQWLYVGGVTSGSVFGVFPPYSQTGYPPPRLLRSQDGVNWQAVPEAPGTFLGSISNPQPGSSRRLFTFRALTVYNGMLFATIGDYRGVGMIIASSNPSAGNDAWFAASPIPEDFPVWNLTVFNNFLYVTTGDKAINNDGFGLYKTTASGPPPFQYQPIITNGAYQLDPRLRAPNGLSFMTFNGQLYLGTNRPTELYRINPDDTWDLIVGEPRVTPQGVKAPLSGMGIGFGDWFNGHFWRMGTFNGQLFLGTWDWSVLLNFIPALNNLFAYGYGTDLYRTEDAIHWRAITRTGMGDSDNFGTRTFESTPFGLFLGTARPQGGFQVFQCQDVSCNETPSSVPAPDTVTSVSQYVSGRQAVISWDPVPGAVQYRVYRATVESIVDLISPSISFTLPGTNQTITLQDIQNGALDQFCTANLNESLCSLVDLIKSGATSSAVAGFPEAFQQIAITGNTLYSEQAPTELQSLYYVRAEDANGNLSDPSNFVGAPSKALPGNPPNVTATITPPPNAKGWNKTPVLVTWTITDGGDGVISPPCPPVQLTAETAGTPLTCTAISGSGAPTTKAVLIKIDMTPPTITGAPSPAANSNGWNNTPVTVTFTCGDALSGVVSCGTTPQVISTEGAGQSATAAAVDQAGNTATATVGNINIDMTPPTITGTPSPAANSNGWNNTPVTVTFTCADSLSGVASCGTTPQVFSTEGAGQSATATVVDLAGNSATATVSNINIDMTPPTISGTPSPAANGNGWNNTPVTVSFTCGDSLSGVSSCGTTPQVLSTEGAGQSATATAVDLAGNSATATVSNINIDMTPPTITGSRTPLANGYGWNNTDVTVTFACADALSGMASCAPTPQVFSAEGAGQSATATAVDLAGNVATATVGGINIDKTPPLLSAVPNPPPNINGWNNTAVTVGFVASDALSGIDTVSQPVTLTNEGAGQVVTGSATDRAGNQTTVSITINIDLTPPEAVLHFDPVSRDIVLEGRDALSGVSVKGFIPPTAVVQVPWQGDGDDSGNALQRTYTVSDLAGNTITLTDVARLHKSEAQAYVVSFGYNGVDPTVAPSNRMKLEWSFGKTGGVKQLEQHFSIGQDPNELEVESHFDLKKNLTSIQSETGDGDSSPGSKTTQQGLFLLKMATASGKLTIQFN